MKKTAVPSWLRTALLAHFVIGFILGALFFAIPGRTMTTLGWVPAKVQLPDSELSVPGQTFVDPIIVRTLGAALLALAYASFRLWQKPEVHEMGLLVRMEAIYCVGGVAAFISGFLPGHRPMPLIGYILLAVLAVFAVIWILAWRSEPKS